MNWCGNVDSIDVQAVPGLPARRHRRPTGRAALVPAWLGHFRAQRQHQGDLLESEQHSRE